MILPFERFAEMFSQCGFDITGEMYERFRVYADMLADWNSRVNLTAITSPEDAAVKHFLDSLLILKYVDIKENAALIDVGSGAGFPGIPLKLYRGDLNVTLIDAREKKVRFLRAVSERLGLGLQCVHGRAEELGKAPDFRGRFDVVTARAVANLTVLAGYCLPFLKKGGVFAAMKGPNEDYKPALGAVAALGGEIRKVFEYRLPNGDKRVLLAVTVKG